MGIGLATALSLGAANYILSSKRELVRVAAKFELNDIREVLNDSLAENAVCMQNFGGMRINDSRVGDPGYFISLPSLSEGPQGLALTPGQPVERATGGLRTQAIRIVNVARGAAADTYKFDVEISFSTGVGSVKPVRLLGFRVTTISSSPPNAKRLQGCSMTGGSGSNSIGSGNCRTVTTSDSVGPHQTMCDPNEFVISGGVRCTLYGLPAQTWSHSDRPYTDPSGRQGWFGDCYNGVSGQPDFGEAVAHVYAVCCR